VYERQKKYNIQLVIMNNNFKLVPIFNALLQQGQGHLLVEAGPRLLESLLSARLANEFIQIISPQKMEVGLSIVNTEQSVVFSPPPPYVLSKQFNLAKDSVKIWKR
jgi:riboflavin biosynthesis pyrimidine reductase